MAKTEKDEMQLQAARGLNNVPWCEQYERMVSGMLYDAFTPVLKEARFRARAWCQEYNSTLPKNATSYDSLSAARSEKLKDIIGRIGDDAYIDPPFLVDYGCNITVGKRFYANFNLTILDCGLVTIGDRVMFGPNVSIYAATHETEVQSRRDDIEYTKPVVVGDDCWIGGQVLILPGVTIGEGCTVAASSVVTKSIPSWSVAMGSPARVVKKVTKLGPYQEKP